VSSSFNPGLRQDPSLRNITDMRTTLIALALLAGCAPPQPTIAASSPRSVMLVRQLGHSMQQSFDVASQHCARYGREAVYQGYEPINWGGGYDQFACQNPSG
jgi:hypothetical protein